MKRMSLDDLSHVQHGKLRRLAGYWLEQRGERALPSRADIDPIDIPWALSSIWMCDFDPVAREFVYRLAGEEISAVYNRSLRGAKLAEIIPARGYPVVRERFCLAPERRAVVHARGRVYRRSDKLFVGERLILPLSDDGDQVDQILGMTVYSVDSRDRDRLETPGHDQVITVTPVERDSSILATVTLSKAVNV